MPSMRAVQVKNANGPFELVEREIPTPAAGQVLIKVEACGICHSDALTKLGAFPGITYPRVPGHEVVGIIDKLGERVPNWKPGRRVGVGWHGGHCGHCPSCRRGDFVTCANLQIPGISYDGGYADYMVAPFEALAAIPDVLQAAEAAPLLCAGITTYNALRNSGVRAGDTVAVLGIGGLGHLGVQFAAKMGCRTIAIARGPGCRRRTEKVGWSSRYPVHRHQFTGDERGARRAGRRRQDDCRWCFTRSDRGLAIPADRRPTGDPGMAVWNFDGVRRHIGFQCPRQHSADDRDDAARTGGRGP